VPPLCLSFPSLTNGRVASPLGTRSRELDAYRLALDALKQGTNTTMYKKVQGLVKGRLGEGYATDQAWVEAVEKRAAATKERLESDLQSSRTSMSKESIRLVRVVPCRVGAVGLGMFSSSCGKPV
jgi:hypothetical protein